jgi:hypothetical protein
MRLYNKDMTKGDSQFLLKRLPSIVGIAVFIIAGASEVPFSSNKVQAGTLNRVFVRLDNLVGAATGVSGRVCFVANVTTAINSFRITFPTTNGATDYIPNTTTTNWTVDTNNLDAQPASEPQNPVTNISGQNAASVSGKQVVFNTTSAFTPASTVPLTGTYCFNWSGASSLTNPAVWTTESVAGTFETFSATGAVGLISTSTFSEPKTVTTNGTNVSVTATVPPSFSFTLNGTTDPFGTINLAAVNYTTGLVGTVVTNAGSGWMIWARSTANAACAKGCIYSPSKLYGIKSAAAVGSAAANVTTGAEHYDFATTAKSLGASGSCSAITQTTYFDGITNAGWGGPLDKTALWPIASCDGSSTSATVSFREILVAIASTPAATDYADTIVMTAAGRF